MENWTMILPLIHTGWVDWASRRQMPSEMVSDHPVLGLGCGTAKVKLGCSIFDNLNSSTIHVSVLCNKTTSDWATEVQWATLDGISGKPRSYSHNWGGGRDSGEGGHNRGRVTPPLDMAKNGHGQTPFFLVFLFARSQNGRTEHLAKKT